MKPSTPEEYAKCYGVFIADLNIVAKELPSVMAWFNTTKFLSDVSTIYKLNKSIFDVYLPNIKSFPKNLVVPRDSENARILSKSGVVDKWKKDINLAWTTITIDLNAALTCADVDPTIIKIILESFAKLKPPTPIFK